MTQRAVRMAREILRRTGGAIPVDVEAIARAHDIAVRRAEFEEGVSGMLVIKDGQAVIGINARHHPNRQRFSLAHELGHYVLHREVASVFVDAAPVFFRDETSADGSVRQEIEANAFAAELLLPEAALREQLGGRPVDALDDLAVRRLAARFGVSAQALTIRLTKLRLITA